MNITNLKLKHRLSIILLLFLSMSTIFTIFPMNSMNSEASNEDFTTNSENDLNTPSISEIGDASWWNTSFEYRMLINITNPHNEALTNFITSISFNYTKLVNEGKMNQSLKDVRIVENGKLRNYYIELNFPVSENATVWFETNISAGPNKLEKDTYLYYGNPNASFAYSYLMANHPEGLIWYKFEEIVNDEVIDYQGNYNATVNGAVLDTDSAVGANSLRFDGSNDYLAIRENFYNTPNGLTEFTVCAFFKTLGTGSYSNNWAIFDYDRSEQFNFYVRGDGGLGFSSFAYGWDETSNWDPNEDPYQDNNYDDFHTTTTTMNDNTWHFGSAVYDGTDKILYIDNGVEDARNDNAHNGLGIGDSTIRYGIIGDGSEASSEDGSRNGIYYNGWLDEIRFFEEALSPERIEWIAKNFNLITDLNKEQIKRASIVITAKDIDGRVVPGLEIYMYNKDFPLSESYLGTTGDQGYLEFPDVNRTEYIITANYSISTGSQTFEEMVYNSSEYSITNDFSGDSHTVYINVSLWSIDFEIEDWNKEPMGYGYVLVYNKTDYTERIANLTLNKEFGTHTFRWINISQDAAYSYEIYYDNADYEKQHTLVNRSIVNRTVYLSKKVVTIPTILVNQTNRWEPPGRYLVQEKAYASGSNETHIGNTKIINTTITLNKMDDNMDSIDIYSIDAYNNVSINPIYSEVYLTETSDIIELNITELADAYGLLIDIFGTNATDVCNGTIDVSYTETYNQYVQVNMSKLEIKVFDDTGEWNPIYGNVLVEVRNVTSKEIVTILLTNDQGIAKGQINTDLGFWYITHNKSYSQRYNFTLKYANGYRSFNVTSDPSNYDPSGSMEWYNYTLYGNGTIEFWMRTSMENYKTEFQEKTWDTSGQWGSNFFFRVKFVSTENAQDIPPTWTAITNPDFVNWEIKDSIGDVTLFSGTMIEEGTGFFNYTFDSTSLIGGDLYLFEITGEETGFQDPDPVQLSFTVSGKSTSLGVYDTSTDAYLGYNLTKYYGEIASLTVKYSSGALLSGASVSYEWQFTDAPVTIPEAAATYSFAINTANADVGHYRITISASLENYTTKKIIFYINIVHRPTALNGDTKLHHITKSIWVQDPYNFTFQYQDTLSDPVINLTDVDDAYYQWYKLDADGNIIGAISNNTHLIEGVNETYILDFNTSLREIGDYALYVTMQKNNYEVRTAFIDLTVKTRVFSATLQPDKFTDNIISVYSGDPFIFNISLHDETRNIPLTGATVQLEFQNTIYTFNETGSGGYSFNITDYNKLMANDDFNISATDIIISKTNFVTHTINITVILNNRMLNALLSEEFVGQLLTIVSGDSLSFEIDIIDSSTASGLLDATITIRIGGEIYEDATIVDNGDGTYIITLESYPDAFFTSEALTGEIIIEKENFRTETISFTVKIEMTEIFPGVPMFYFLMIVGSVVAIVGSLATYRIVQQRRIPTFVKKARTMKKDIKGQRYISDSLLYPIKEAYIVKKFGDKWEKLGLSLEEILGIKGKVKKEKLSIDKVDEKKIEKEKLKKDKLEKKKREREKQEQEKLVKKKLQKEKLEKEKLEKEKLEDNELPKERGEEE